MLSPRPTHAFLALVAVSFPLALGACAAAPSASMAPPAAASPTTAAPPGDDAGSDIDRAEADLNRALARKGGQDKKKGEAPSAGGRPKDAGGPPKQDEENSVDPNACGTACDALASMGRAAQHLCDLTGDSEPRCQSARDRVDRARQRVNAECSVCPG